MNKLLKGSLLLTVLSLAGCVSNLPKESSVVEPIEGAFCVPNKVELDDRKLENGYILPSIENDKGEHLPISKDVIYIDESGEALQSDVLGINYTATLELSEIGEVTKAVVHKTEEKPQYLVGGELLEWHDWVFFKPLTKNSSEYYLYRQYKDGEDHIDPLPEVAMVTTGKEGYVNDESCIAIVEENGKAVDSFHYSRFPSNFSGFRIIE